MSAGLCAVVVCAGAWPEPAWASPWAWLWLDGACWDTEKLLGGCGLIGPGPAPSVPRYSADFRPVVLTEKFRAAVKSRAQAAPPAASVAGRPAARSGAVVRCRFPLGRAFLGRALRAEPR